MGDSVADESTVFVGVHKGCTLNHRAIKVPFPPITAPKPLASFTYIPFNNKQHAVSLGHLHPDFAESGCISSPPTPSATPTQMFRAKRIYQIHRRHDNQLISAGAGVYDTAGLCPPFCATNSNLFASTFGIEFDDESTTLVRPISSYEVTKCYRLHDDLTYVLAHPANFLLLDCAIPTQTSRAFFNQIIDRLDEIRTANFEIHDPALSHAPAAITMAP